MAIYTSKTNTSFSDGVQHEIEVASTITIPRGSWNFASEKWDYPFMFSGIGESSNGNYIRIALMEVDGRSDYGPLRMNLDRDTEYSWSLPSSSGESIDPTPAISLIAQTLISILNPNVGVNIITSLLFTFLGMIKNTSNGYNEENNHFTRTLSWSPDINWTSQSMKIDTKVLSSEPGESVSFTAEYGVLGPTYEYLSGGKHIISIEAPYIVPDGPSAMTYEEREAAGIITVPRSQLQEMASELGIDYITVQEMMDSEVNEFYFTSATPLCVTEVPGESDQGYESEGALLDAIAEKITMSEKIITAFSEENIRDLSDSREIVAKHTVRLEGLRALDRLVRLGIHGQDSLERAYSMYWNIVGHASDLISNFGNEVLLGNVSSGYIREALSRGPALLSDTLDGLRATAASGLLGNISDGESLLVGSDWLRGNDARMRMIADLASSGLPIILTGDNPDVLSTENTGLPTAYSSSAGVFGLWHDNENNATYCYNDSGGDLNESIESAFGWAENPQSSTSIPEQYLAPVDSVVYSLTKTHGNFGDLIVETEYDMIEIDTDLTLVVTHYKLTGDANISTSFWDKWTAVADLRVSCDHEHSYLYDYEPCVSPAGNGLQAVNLYHFDAEYYDGWSYTIDDATFHNLSIPNNDTFSLWYDIGECQENDGKSYTIEPGTFTEVSATEIDAWIQEMEEELNYGRGEEEEWIEVLPFRYMETEHYSVSFFRDRTLLPDQMETVNCDITVTLM